MNDFQSAKIVNLFIIIYYFIFFYNKNGIFDIRKKIDVAVRNRYSPIRLKKAMCVV